MSSNKQALEDMPTKFVMCRMLRHNWDFDGFHHGSFEGRRWTVLKLKCRCGTQRHDYLNHRGELIHRWYGRPNGYNIIRNKKERREGRLSVSQVRAEMMSRHPVKANGRKR